MRFFVLACALSAAQRSWALLAAASGGYQYTAGDDSYYGHDTWGYGSLRLPGGWYPFVQMAGSVDRDYKWILSPGGGVEKGLPGVGKLRAGYTLSRGALRDSDLRGTSHGLEAGWSRAFTLWLSADLSYRLTSGNLFGGLYRELESEDSALALRHAVFHQGSLSVGVELPVRKRKMRIDGSFSGATSPGRELYFETLTVASPPLASFSLFGSVTLVQARGEPDRKFFGGGLLYAWQGSVKDRSGR